MQQTSRDRARAALAVHAPELTTGPLEQLGSGLDHTAFRAGDLVVRVAGDGGAVREARLLALLGTRVELPVPRPVFADEERGVLAYACLPGRPLLGRTPPADAAAHLGRFLRDLHGVDPVAVAGLVPTDDDGPVAWLEDLDGPPHLLDELRRSVPPPSDDRVLAHADLGAEHVLELDGRITGVLDWSDAAVADPAVDLARLLRDFGPAFVDRVVASYGRVDEAAWARVTFYARCAALEDLAHGRRTGLPAYARNAERSLGWLFDSRGRGVGQTGG